MHCVCAAVALACGRRQSAGHWWPHAEVSPCSAGLAWFGRHILIISSVAAIFPTSFTVVSALVAPLLVHHPVYSKRCVFRFPFHPLASCLLTFACVVSVTQLDGPVNLRYVYDTSRRAKRRCNRVVTMSVRLLCLNHQAVYKNHSPSQVWLATDIVSHVILSVHFHFFANLWL